MDSTVVESNPPAPDRKSRRRLIVLGGAAAAVVVAAIVVIAAVGLPALKSPPKVLISSEVLSFDPSNNPCFTSNYENTTPLTVAVGGIDVITVPLVNQSNGKARDCAIESVSTNTTGFSIESATVPLSVRGTGTTNLVIDVNVPKTAYTGPLNLMATASYISPNVTVTKQNPNFVNATASAYCGISAPTSTGFTAFGGSAYNDSIGFAVISPVWSCSVVAVSAATTGFTVLSASVPFDLPINSFTGVSFVLEVPSTVYTGVLNVTITLNQTGPSA